MAPHFYNILFGQHNFAKLTLGSLKLRLDATILLGEDTVAPTIQLGGNLGRNRVETDDLQLSTVGAEKASMATLRKFCVTFGELGELIPQMVERK